MVDKMGRPVTVRLYGKTLNRWTAFSEALGREIETQTEVAYKEYDSETGDLVAVGSEDFSPSRWRSEVSRKWVHTWDGERRNKGGHRWFDDRGLYSFRKSERKAVVDYLRKVYAVEVIELR